MAELARGEAEQLLRFVADAESIGSDQPFTPDLLVELGHLVEADWVTYSELDRVRPGASEFSAGPTMETLI